MGENPSFSANDLKLTALQEFLSLRDFVALEGLATLCVPFPSSSPEGPCKLFEAHGLTAFGLFPHKSLQEQAPYGLARKKPNALR